MYGMPHCDDVDHLMHSTHCIRTVHAEANAIVQAACNGTSIKGSTIYVTAVPCFECFKLIVNARIQNIVYDEFYRGEFITEIADTCRELGIGLRQLKESER